jgi:hypothetical protein
MKHPIFLTYEDNDYPMRTVLLERLVDKTISKQELLDRVKLDSNVLSIVIEGLASPKAAIRYGCAKVLMDLSAEDPEKLYPHMKVFIALLDSNYRILTWNALAIIANLTRVDHDLKFDSIFDKYYSLLQNEYMVTVANVIGNSSIIALAKPYLIPKITDHLLSVKGLSLTPHLTEECKKVLVQHAINAFDSFFTKIEAKERVIDFVKQHSTSSRKKLQTTARQFLETWNSSR